MNLLSRFRIPFGDPDQPHFALREFTGQEPLFSVLIGENGTRKSFILRQILDAALDANRNASLFGDVEFARTPAQVVAVSAFASDRFPTSPTVGDLFYIGRYRDRYAYIGPRTSRNLISRQHNSRQLMLALLRGADRLPKLKSLARRLRDTLLVPPYCLVGLNASTGLQAHKAPSLEKYLESVQSTAPGRKPPLRVQDFGNIKKASSELERALKSRPTPPASKRSSVVDAQIVLHFDWTTGTFDGGSISPDTLEVGLRTGYLRQTHLNFGGLDDDSLSAGQWALFCGTYILGLTARDDALVLIDEPECGLHPQWQRSFMDLTRMALNGLTGCHVVVATHSSLLLSSLPASCSEVISLERHDDRIVPRHIEVPSGWDATNVIEEVFGADSARGPEITAAFHLLLSLVAGGRPMRSEFKAEVKRVEPLVKYLPPDDPLRITFAALKEAALGSK